MVAVFRYNQKSIKEKSKRGSLKYFIEETSCGDCIPEVNLSVNQKNKRRIEKGLLSTISGMKLAAWNFVSCIFLAVLLLGVAVSAYPTNSPEKIHNLEAIENMRQIPQWHCLNYRKFDLVRRCRNYRFGRKQ